MPTQSLSYWQTPEGKLDQAIRDGLREAGIQGILGHIVGPILRSVQAELARQQIDEVDYEHDWAGEVRIDPEDGNGYVLRAVSVDLQSGSGFGDFYVYVNDILGEHERRLSLLTWLGWDSKP